ncbi:MAG: hypothetical protein HQK53_14380 [Oligoflexia bacterium]|nr:hypothetical protein [Oligoflexia bacterium]
MRRNNENLDSFHNFWQLLSQNFGIMDTAEDSLCTMLFEGDAPSEKFLSMCQRKRAEGNKTKSGGACVAARWNSGRCNSGRCKEGAQ